LFYCPPSERTLGVTVGQTSDITNADEASYQKGYNEATQRHVDSTFGKGAFQSAIAEVERFRLLQYKQHFGRS
jgi:hypothetical protein